MDSARWQRIQNLFHEAINMPEAGRQTFLQSQCADDPDLAGEVIVLLKEDAQGDSLLDGDIAHVAHQLIDDSTSALPFHEFGPYRIVKSLGEGGMGIVYLAERKDLETKVAIKLLRDAWLSPARRNRFAIEQRTLAQLNHPSIARLYDADTSPDGTPFFVMEYVEGVPLTGYSLHHNCSVTERIKLFRSVCEAVLYAHQHAVIHRDLKPSNILVKDDGTVHLLDFGIAKHMESVGGTVEQTTSGLRLMTPAYSAPEQVLGEQIGIQTDVYSLGVILYELLAERLPFDLSNRTPTEAAKILTEQEVVRPSTIVRLLQHDVVPGKAAWADLDVLCLTAMHRDLQRRYQSVEALLRDIDHYLKNEPLEARADNVRYRLAKFITRNQRAVMAGSAVFVVIVGLIIFFTVRLTIARNAALAEAARTQRIQKFIANLFQGGDAEAGPADSLRVVTLLDRGVQEAQSLNAEPEIQADLYETLGTIYQKLGKLDQADSLLNSSLTIRKAKFGENSPQVAQGLIALGLLRDDQAKLPEAENLARQGLAISQKDLPPNHPQIAKAKEALGGVLDDRGSYDAAIQTLQDAVHLQTANKAPAADLAASLYELANAHFYAGHYDQSETLNQQLLVMYRQIYGDRHPRDADVLVNLGEIRQAQGRYEEAEKYDRQAVDIVQAWYGKENPKTAIDLTILARSLVYQKRYNGALDLLKQSLAIKERVYGEAHPSVASTLNELGNTASMENNFDAAAQYFTRMMNIYRQTYGEHHYLYGVALSNLGSVYMRKQEWTHAEKIFRQAVQIFTESESPTHVNTGIARIKLGRTLLRQHRYAEAETETRAGYDILVKQMDPKASWLVSARQDLAEDYTALKQPEKAAEFRASPVLTPSVGR